MSQTSPPRTRKAASNFWNFSVPWSDSSESEWESELELELEEEGNEDYRLGGYHAVQLGETFKAGRYLVLRKLGWGHYSTVWLAWDNVNIAYVALKVQKSHCSYTEAAIDEIAILKEIAAKDREGCKGVAKLLDHFEHGGPNGQHVCMVFELLGDNLRSLVKHQKNRGLPLDTVRQLASQILVGLEFLHRELSMIHIDLKPDNILLHTPRDSSKDPRNSGLLNSMIMMCPRCGRNSTASSLVGVQGCNKTVTCVTKNIMQKMQRRSGKAGNICHALVTRLWGKETTYAEQNFSSKGGLAASGSTAEAVARPWWNMCCFFPISELKDVVLGKGVHGALRPFKEPDNVPQTLQFTSTALMSADLDDDDLVEVPGLEYTPLSQGHGQAEDGMNLNCKIVDLGRACRNYKQRTDDTQVQTREYRCPEAVLGAKYSYSADMWSFACVVFELATGDILFSPDRGHDDYDSARDQHHLALMIELLGPMPSKIALSGQYSFTCFNSKGELKNFRKLRYWPIDRLLIEKYGFNVIAAQQLADFVCPLLDFDPDKRPTACQSLLHPWLDITRKNGTTTSCSTQHTSGFLKYDPRAKELS